MRDFSELDEVGEFEEQGGVPVLVPLGSGYATAYPVNEVFASIVGWENIPTDDNADPVEFQGVRLVDGKFFSFVSASRNLAVGKDYTYLYRGEVSTEEFFQLVKWAEEKYKENFKEALLEERKKVASKLATKLSDLVE